MWLCALMPIIPRPACYLLSLTVDYFSLHDSYANSFNGLFSTNKLTFLLFPLYWNQYHIRELIKPTEHDLWFLQSWGSTLLQNPIFNELFTPLMIIQTLRYVIGNSKYIHIPCTINDNKFYALYPIFSRAWSWLIIQCDHFKVSAQNEPLSTWTMHACNHTTQWKQTYE